MQKAKLGTVIAGSLTEGLTVRLDAATSIEDLRVGQFVVIQGEQHQFFSMIGDVKLDAANRDVLADPPPDDDEFLRRVLGGTTTYGTFTVAPMLMLSTDVTAGLRPVRTVPRHFAPVYSADEDDFAQVFGAESERGGAKFQIGPMALVTDEASGVSAVLASKRIQAADQEMFRHVGVEPSEVPILGLKSTVHFRADFQPIAETILVVQSPGAHITDPLEMPYKHLRKGIRLKPMGPVWNGTPA